MRKKKTQRVRSDTTTKKKRVYKKKTAVKKPRKNSIPKIRNQGTMTEAMFWNWIRQLLRRKSMYWKPISKVKNDAKVPYVGENKRRKFSYICSKCKHEFASTEVNVHHIIPCGTLTCSQDLGIFVENLFCEEDKLILLCSGCHDKEHKKINLVD